MSRRFLSLSRLALVAALTMPAGACLAAAAAGAAGGVYLTSRGAESLWLSMYLSIRDYAREQHEGTPDARGAMERHAEWALMFAEPLSE